jgi:predicted TIM-barrel fold metal-dependent hydrolase
VPLIRIAYEAFGARRLMWASDVPTVLRLCTYHQTLAHVRGLEFLTEWDKQWIFGQTALNVMRFPTAGAQDSSSLLFEHH